MSPFSLVSLDRISLLLVNATEVSEGPFLAKQRRKKRIIKAPVKNIKEPLKKFQLDRKTAPPDVVC